MGYTARSMMLALVVALCAARQAMAHSHEDQTPIAGPHQGLWYNTLPGDGGTQVGAPWLRHGSSPQIFDHAWLISAGDVMQADAVFSGISTFGRLTYAPCLADVEIDYDIAFIGAFENDFLGAAVLVCEFVLAKRILQGRPLTRARHIVPGPGSARPGSAKVLDVSISSTCIWT